MAWTQRAKDTFVGTWLQAIIGRTPDMQGAAWTGSGTGLSIGINNDLATNGSTVVTHVWIPTSIANKQASEATQGPSSAANFGGGVNVRAGTGPDCYSGFLRHSNPWNDAFIHRVDDGTPTQLASASSVGLSTGDKIRIEADGSTLTLLKNTTQIAQTTDSTYASGYGGTSYFGSNFDYNIDDLTVYDEAAAAGNPWYAYAQQ